MKLLLDTGVLGRICHPRRHSDVRGWFGRAVREHEFLISELADYELRRELLRIGAARSLSRLDELARGTGVRSDHHRHLAARRRSVGCRAQLGRGNGTAGALDGDVLVAAQALEEGALVLSTNVKHFERLTVRALEWTAVPIE